MHVRNRVFKLCLTTIYWFDYTIKTVCGIGWNGHRNLRKGIDKSPSFSDNRYAVRGLLAQLVEHIVHIDGVTGSSPVQTTILRLSVDTVIFPSKIKGKSLFLFCL